MTPVRGAQPYVGAGGGIYFNYGFTLLWIADTIWWWAAPQRRAGRPG